MASSVDLFSLYANWWGSKAGGRQSLMWSNISLSKHLATTGVKAMGLKSFRLVMVEHFAIGIMTDVLRQGGTMACARERLKIFVRTPESSLAHALRTLAGIPSGPVAFLVFTDLSTRLT